MPLVSPLNPQFIESVVKTPVAETVTTAAQAPLAIADVPRDTVPLAIFFVVLEQVITVPLADFVQSPVKAAAAEIAAVVHFFAVLPAIQGTFSMPAGI